MGSGMAQGLKVETEGRLDMKCRLFVSNISYRVTRREFTEFFSKFGDVVNARMVKDHKTRQSRGFGFVTFANDQSAEKVLSTPYNDLVLDTRVMRVSRAEPSKQEQLRQTVTPTASSSSPSTVSSSFPITECEEHSYIVPLLSDDALLLIFSYLGLKDLIRIERVCKRWQFICLRLWQSKRKLDFSSVFNPFQLCQDGRMSAPYLTDNILFSLLKRSSNSLQHLDLSASSRFLTDFSFDAIGMCCPGLQKLDISGVAITHTSLQLLCERLLELKWLKMKGCYEVGEMGLWWLLHGLKKLEYLNVESNKRLTGQCFFQSSGLLRTVMLNDCVQLTDDGLCLLLERSPQLEVLQCNNCRLLTGKSIGRIAELCAQLKEVHLACTIDTSMSEELHISSLGTLHSLEVLVVDRRQGVDDLLLHNLGQNSSRLRRLSFEGCTRVSDLSLLSTCPNLSDLNVSYCKLTDSGLQTVAEVGLLRRFVARGCSGLTYRSISEVVEFCLQLHQLDVSRCVGVTDRMLSTLQQVLTGEVEEDMNYGAPDDEEDWDNNNEVLMEKAEDFLLADDPALFSDEFSDQDNWDVY